MNVDDEKQLAEYKEYIRDCEECSTVPTVSGAFQWAWEAALAQPQFQKLGARLAELLDEDQWAECEAMLRKAGVTPDYPSPDWGAGYRAGLIYAAELCEVMPLYTGLDCAVKIREELADNA